MNEARDLLIEIGTEELPPKALARLAAALTAGITQGFDKARLEIGPARSYAAPRRLAVLVAQVPLAQADREELRRGPAVAAAFDADGKPTQAALGFARSCGVEVEDLERLETDKGSWLAYRKLQRGAATRTLVPEIVDNALAGLPIPKRMRWGASDVEFVRPVHWVVLLLGDEVIDAEILGVRTGRETHGHRFHHPAPLHIGEPAAYAPLLETEGHVLPDREARREAVRGQVLAIAAELGGRALIDDDLLDEVTALVEWPVALAGSFDRGFLEVPQEALISAMQDHQKYFPVVDGDGRLLPHFITVANIESRDPAQVRTGNERVIRPRLADARFFWDQDRRQRLEERCPKLADMVFQQKLGTLADKQQRVAEVAAGIAEQIGADARDARRAAQLAKCDLLTQMVYEFPELQGIMGRYYAVHDGEPAEVAEAIEEQYRPRFAGDAIPRTGTGQALAVADRLDTLVGIFAIGQPPSGDKDPFALRRAALGVVRILIEGERDLDLMELLVTAARQFPYAVEAPAAVEPVFEFVIDRLRAYYQEQGIPLDVFEAVRERRPTRPLDFDRRLRAVDAFRALPEADSLAAANKRIGNILRKAEESVPDEVDPGVLTEPQEQALAETLKTLAAEVEPLLAAGDYTAALQRLAGLREPVDAFFDAVMVMAEDPKLRANRLALLARLHALFLRVADLSRLQG